MFDRMEVHFTSMAAQLLELCDASGETETRATGFVIEEEDGLFLYACWHSVTGVDFLAPNPHELPTRRSVTLVTQDVEDRAPGVKVIGGSTRFNFDLYDKDGKPKWIQQTPERPNPDLNCIGLRLPQSVDLIRMPISLPPKIATNIALQKSDVFDQLLGPINEVVILGYPYGYSAMEEGTPEPVFLKRSIASFRYSNPYVSLLDGTGTPGMSGSPMFISRETNWLLVGVYTGFIYPDYQHKVGKSSDRFAALGLMTQINMARDALGVPDALGG